MTRGHASKGSAQGRARPTTEEERAVRWLDHVARAQLPRTPPTPAVLAPPRRQCTVRP